MNSEEVLKLIDAGFTADEIRKMSVDEPAPTNDEPAPTNDETTPPKNEPAPSANDNFMDEIRKSVEDINAKVKALQDANIKTAEEKKIDHMSAADVVTSFMENL